MWYTPTYFFLLNPTAAASFRFSHLPVKQLSTQRFIFSLLFFIEEKHYGFREALKKKEKKYNKDP